MKRVPMLLSSQCLITTLAVLGLFVGVMVIGTRRVLARAA